MVAQERPADGWSTVELRDLPVGLQQQYERDFRRLEQRGVFTKVRQDIKVAY